MEVDELIDKWGVAENGGDGQVQGVDDTDALFAERRGTGGAVVDAGQRCDGVKIPGFSSGKERREVVRVGSSPLFLAAVGQKIGENADRRAAEGVADKVNFLVSTRLSPVGENAGIRSAEPGVVIFLAVDFSVVNRTADDSVVGVAGAVPGAAYWADRRGENFIVFAAQVLDEIDVRSEPPIRSELVDAILFSKAHKAVEQDDRVFVFVHSLTSYISQCIICCNGCSGTIPSTAWS